VSRSEKITFANDQGIELAAKMDWPGGGVRHYAVFAHCFTCSKDTAAASRISRALTDHGIAVLRFDFTGLGSSGGDFANTNFSSNVRDLLSACRFIESRYGTGPALAPITCSAPGPIRPTWPT